LRNYFEEEFHYIIQYEPKGIAHGLLFAEEFISEEKLSWLLGDNLFDFDLKNFVLNFQSEDINCKILLKEVEEPERYRVAYIGDEKIIDLVEKQRWLLAIGAVTVVCSG